jgi:PKD domain
MESNMNTHTLFRISITIAIALGLAVPAGFTALAQAPANDNFADAIIIGTAPFNDTQSTSDATKEDNEPISSCAYWDGYSPEHTIWYAYTPTADEIVHVSIARDYEAFLAIYSATGPTIYDLSEVGCWSYVEGLTINMQAGITYYLQIGGMWEASGNITLTLDVLLPPPNDNFADAMLVNLGEPVSVDNTAATTELGEPPSGCTWYGFSRTVWFMYTPEADGFITASLDGWPFFLAAYTGSELSSLTEIGCRSYYWDPLPIRVVAGQTYYFQLGSSYEWEYGQFSFYLYPTPDPIADFGWSPGDPNVYENIEFCDWTNDPVSAGIAAHTWEFGDGSASSDNCAYHQYAADGDYTVFHNIITSDGRIDSDGATKTVSVRTHDVSITKVTAPLSASARQTRAITVDVKNTRYPENVRLVLYKSVVGGYQEVSYLNQYVPVRAGNRTSRFSFNYTFTPQDAALGKVTFKAVAELQDARDAFPADNEAVSTPPTKVTGKLATAAQAAPSPQ